MTNITIKQYNNRTIEIILSVLLLIFSIGFNLWIYKLEPTATTDPNDNTFQFGLVDRTNTIWDFATKKCSSSLTGIITFPVCHFSYLADHWVHNWAEGYNLPYYYSHVPQILIVGGWRLISLFIPQLSLFQFYHIVIYLLMCFFPLTIYLALLVMQLSPLTAGIGAVFAMNLSTDGLYGLDPSSFLWRGYGLSSQLFAMLWFPLALAFAYRFFADTQVVSSKQIVVSKKTYTIPLPTSYLLLATIFTAATTAGHLGIGMITMLSLGFLAVSAPLMTLIRQQPVNRAFQLAKTNAVKLTLVAGIAIFLLSYWILPTFIHTNFHNISFWDPVWKFDSYGWKETMIRLFNGDLFDFGRFPYLTLLILLGFVACLKPQPTDDSINHEKDKNTIRNSQFVIPNSLFPFSFLFIFWLVFYFGRTTWGGLIDLIPGMKDFHLSRFLVGLHVSGMFLAPIGFIWLVNWVTGWTLHGMKALHIRLPANHLFIRLFVYLFICLLLVPPIYKWTLTYNELNDTLIVQANGNYAKVKPDEQALFAKLRSLPPGRIFAGRGGGYGKQFQVAETPYFMHLSTYGLPTTLWLPETWSMNSDTEQYFSEDQQKDYDLYNIKYVAAPPEQATQPFWTQIAQAPTWKLYEVPTTGYFTVGQRVATVSVGKQSFVNLVHLWIQSDMHKNGLFPELTFDKTYPKKTGRPNFRMTDEVTYVTPDGKKRNIWTEPPVYLPPGVNSIEGYNAQVSKLFTGMQLIGPETVDTDMVFSTKVDVGANCQECIVVLKQTSHPNWKAYVDGQPTPTFIVFPFYTAVEVTTPGMHDITFAYEPSKLKVFLLVLAIASVIGAVVLYRYKAVDGRK